VLARLRITALKKRSGEGRARQKGKNGTRNKRGNQGLPPASIQCTAPVLGPECEEFRHHWEVKTGFLMWTPHVSGLSVSWTTSQLGNPELGLHLSLSELLFPHQQDGVAVKVGT
jgi:hypothetical protein